MTAKSTRILKEARPLVGPWCAIALTGLLPLLPGLHYADQITALGFYLGIPVLATLSFGNEFQHRTFALVLSQPIERKEIWREKLMVTVFAVVSAALVFSLTLGAQLNHRIPQFFIFIAACTLAIIASAAFWTLWTRSTMGGLALNLAVLGLILIWADVEPHLIDSPYSVEENSAAISRVVLILLCYAALMLWLGWRRLAGFQATGTMAGDDLVTAGPEVMPKTIAYWFRSRSTGAILNLIRKEFRLLRPVWLLTILTAAGWSGFTIFEVLRERAHVKFLPLTAGEVGLAGAVIMAILAGCLSVGEERASGRHAWHLTLPVSMRVQWLVKFLTALFAGALCAGVVPILLLAAGKHFLGMNVLADHPDYPTLLFRSMLMLTALAFWCACATDGAVTAVLWTFPMLMALGSAHPLGDWIAGKLMHLVDSRFNVFGNFRFDVIMLHAVFYFRSAPAKNLPELVLRAVVRVVEPYAFGENSFLIWIPTAIVAAIQSYRMFKKQAVSGVRMVVRRLLPLVGFVLGCSMALSAIGRFGYLAVDHAWEPVQLTHRAIENLLADSGSPNSGKSMELTAKDLDNAYHLPKDTRQWLNNARITLIPKGPTGVELPTWFTGRRIAASNYEATIHLENGTDLAMSYGRSAGDRFAHFDVRIHWPGTAGDEPL